MNPRPTRQLEPEENLIVRDLRARRGMCAYVTTTEPVPMGSKDHKGPWNGNPDRIIPTGTTIKVVMMSGMGDCGLTDDLSATHGYAVRLDVDDAAITNWRLEP